MDQDLFPSACIWHEKGALDRALQSIKQTAFHYVDVEPNTLDRDNGLETLKKLGLKVSCVAIDHGLPAGVSWDKDPRAVVPYLEKALARAKELGATAAYVGPPKDGKQLRAYRESIAKLAESAAGRGIRFSLEHVPGKALATARETLAFVKEVGHPNLYLLLDVGHAQLTREKAWEVVEAAGERIGYVQLDDNDGKKDRHWPLLDGLLTWQALARTLAALKAVGYRGTLGLEIAPHPRVSLVSSLSKNHNLVLRLQQAQPEAAAAGQK